MKEKLKIKAINKLDIDYLSLVKDVLDNGQEKKSRAGNTISYFGGQIRIDLNKGFPLLTTKKVFTRGAIHELLWFLKRPYSVYGDMNIKYLVENNVHIWDDDAYRWFKTTVKRYVDGGLKTFSIGQEKVSLDGSVQRYFPTDGDENDDNVEWLLNIQKGDFLDMVLNEKIVLFNGDNDSEAAYKFGSLGRIYGTQWREWMTPQCTIIDQINNIIETLKTNPNDRRMICTAFNPSDLSMMALPPCHFSMQFYARELSNEERINYACKIDPTFNDRKGDVDKENIPTHALSCMWNQRSCDCCLGLPINIASYALLTHMISKLVNMVPESLIGSFGDMHVYCNQFDGIAEQFNRKGYDSLPTLKIHGSQETIDDFKFDDFEICNYESDDKIFFPLSVGN